MATKGSRLLGALLLLPLLTACAMSPAKQAEPVTPVQTPTPVPTPDLGPVVKPASAEWQVVRGVPGNPASVAGPGLFLVDARTGESEFWPTLPGDNVKITLTADSLYVWSVNQSETRLADRSTGKAFSWTAKDRRLVGALANRLLWEVLDAQGSPTGKARLEQLDGALVKELDLSQNRELRAQSLRLTKLDVEAFYVWRDARDDWRIDGMTGDLTQVPRTDQSDSRFYNPKTDRAYKAELYQNTFPFVTVGMGGDPEYRILAAYPSCGWAGLTSSPWRADGEGIVLWSGDGPFMANLETGQVESLAVKQVEEGYDYWLDPAPSPSRNDRWGALADTQAEVRLLSFGPGTIPVATGAIRWDRQGTSMDTHLPLWSADGRFLQFQAFNGGGKDFGCLAELVGEPFLPPLLQKAPFREIAVVVQTGGECLNLRAEPSKQARVLTCLPDGTELTFLEKPQGGNEPYAGYYPGWARVRTNEGLEGWVNTEERYLTWAA